MPTPQSFRSDRRQRTFRGGIKPPTAMPVTPDNLAAALYTVVIAAGRRLYAAHASGDRENFGAAKCSAKMLCQHTLLYDRVFDSIVERGLARATRLYQAHVRFLEFFVVDEAGHHTQVSVQTASRHAPNQIRIQMGDMLSTLKVYEFCGFHFKHARDWPPATSYATRHTWIDSLSHIKTTMRLCDAEATLKAWLGPGADQTPEVWRLVCEPWA